MANLDYNRQVFINCPFDSLYQKLFEAIHFAVLDSIHTRDLLPKLSPQ